MDGEANGIQVQDWVRIPKRDTKSTNASNSNKMDHVTKSQCGHTKSLGTSETKKEIDKEIDKEPSHKRTQRTTRKPEMFSIIETWTSEAI